MGKYDAAIELLEEMGLAKSRFSKEYRQLMKSPQWKLIRVAVLKRDGYKCRKCGGKGEKSNPLQVDHLSYPPKGSPLSAFINQPLSDYQTLCCKCHRKKTYASRKGR